MDNIQPGSTVTLGQKITIKIKDINYEGYVTCLEVDGYVVIYAVDGRIEFETVKI